MKHLLFVLLLLTSPCRSLLLTAQALNAPDYPLSIREAVLRGDRPQVAALCRAWYAGGTFSTGELNWNYNALMSIEPGATLITQNDQECYAVWVLQQALGLRTDVTVISLQSIEDHNYRNFVSTGKTLDLTAGSRAELLQNLLSPGNKTPVYLGVTLDKNLLEAGKNNLYLTGLALKYSQAPFDNIAVLKNNFERRFLLDYLRQNLHPEREAAKIAAMNLNYLPAFLLLHRHYSAQGDTARAGDLEQLSLRIARAGNREAEVQAFFMPAPTDPPARISVKSIEKNMKKVGDRLWADQTEATNGQYELFLQDLLRNRNYDQLERCKPTKTDWRSLLPDSLKQTTEASLFENGHPDAPNMPAQNISHEAAQLYCAWLTTAYNGSTDKKKYKKVLFRLPSEQEWKLASQGGRGGEYPWGGFYVRNSKGCYLANFNASDTCSTCVQKVSPGNDGGFFPVAAESYFPNNFGLYNTCGNVAEMLGEPGKAKGGSWQDPPWLCQTTPVKTYTAPSPAIGFRVFMEVIEE